jgi:preprotein translocase subunit SecB
MNEEAESQQSPVFNLEKLYVKDISLEIPHAPAIYLEREAPQIELQLNSQASPIGDGVYEVAVTVTVTAKLKEQDKVSFLIEAKQAGVFQIRNIPQEELEPVLSVVCPNMLYPYLREVVSDVSVRAGFAPVLLNPINFEVLYHQQKQQQQAQAEAAAAPITH